MPLFEYRCEDCGLLFEELKNGSEETDLIKCRKCGGRAKKLMSTFSASVVGSESVDSKIGREAESRWEQIHARQEKRRSAVKETKEVSSFSPVLALGSSHEVSQRKEYVSALKEHRKEREKKGQSQFSGPGEF